MVTYYNDGRVRITSVELAVDGRAYRLAELVHVWRRRSRSRRRSVSRRAAGNLLMLGGGVLGLACFCVASSLWRLRLWAGLTPMGLAILAAGFVAGSAVTWPLWQLVLSGMDRLHIHGLETHELWVHWRGADLLLVRTTDALRFGQIYRALGRAMEVGG